MVPVEGNFCRPNRKIRKKWGKKLDKNRKMNYDFFISSGV